MSTKLNRWVNKINQMKKKIHTNERKEEMNSLTVCTRACLYLFMERFIYGSWDSYLCDSNGNYVTIFIIEKVDSKTWHTIFLIFTEILKYRNTIWIVKHLFVQVKFLFTLFLLFVARLFAFCWHRRACIYFHLDSCGNTQWKHFNIHAFLYISCTF